MRQMKVDKLGIDLLTHDPVVILKDLEGKTIATIATDHGVQPQTVIDKLAAASARAANAPAVVARLQRDGVDLVGGTPAQFGSLIARELVQWRELAKAANISLQ